MRPLLQKPAPRHFLRDRGGSIVLIVAAALPVLCTAVLGGIEYAEAARTKARLQIFVDQAALKGAQEFFADKSTTTEQRTSAFADELANTVRPRWTITTSVSSNPTAGSMTVGQQGTRRSMFGNLVPPGGWKIAATATAVLMNKTSACVLALQQGGSQVISVGGSSMITAPGCLAQSDSDLYVNSVANVQAGKVQTVGSSTGPVSPAALTGTPVMPDPFGQLAISVPTSPCVDNGLVASSGNYTLQAGVHCGALKLTSYANVALASGEHYFVSGAVSVIGNA